MLQQAVPVMEVIASQQLLGSWRGVSRGGTVVVGWCCKSRLCSNWLQASGVSMAGGCHECA